jgi:hypothetical protein
MFFGRNVVTLVSVNRLTVNGTLFSQTLGFAVPKFWPFMVSCCTLLSVVVDSTIGSGWSARTMPAENTTATAKAQDERNIWDMDLL